MYILFSFVQILLNQSCPPPPLIITFSLPCPGLRSDNENAEQMFFFWKCDSALIFQDIEFNLVSFFLSLIEFLHEWSETPENVFI